MKQKEIKSSQFEMVRGMCAKYPCTTKYLLVSGNNLGKMSNSIKQPTAGYFRCGTRGD